MRFNISYDAQDEMVQNNLQFLERRLYVARGLIPPGYESYFQESARYTSAHTSTAIEGNTLAEEEAMLVLVEGADPGSPPQVEKVNLEEAYELMTLLAADKTTNVDQGIIRTVNSLVLKGLPDSQAKNRGRYRVGPNLIIDSTTREIRYRPPPPAWIPELMENLVESIKNWIEQEPGSVAAALAHFGLISIHPFDDGNGRTARLIADMVLNLTDCSADGMLSVSKVIHQRLPQYYDSLREAQGEDFQEDVDVTSFVRFHSLALSGAAVVLEEKAINFSRLRDDFFASVDGMLNTRQVTGLMFMLDIGPISSSRYARLTQSSQATAQSDLAYLAERNLATRQGAGKSTRYIVGPRAAEIIERAGTSEGGEATE